MTEELKQKVAQMYNDGWNPEDIAEELCLDETEVIEYVYKDAFIEKAEKFIKDNIDHYIGHYLNDDDTYLDDSFFPDFKNYMKGE